MGSGATRLIQRLAGAALLVSAFLILAGAISTTLNPTQAQDPSVVDIAPLSGGSISITSSNSGPCTSFNTG
ncbi:hypothetical protein FWC63_03020, partial [Candidatus Saccharibacteria bacterium]|nr:hypothetical protein [Candidatus Saccharibacteria bacterium]